MWKLWHMIFGWDYIAWSNSADQGIARIHVDGDGICYYWRYSNTSLQDKVDPLKVRWLTCPSTKYYPKKEQTDGTTT